nr:hypothetical protein CTI12_AA450800 [Tanacetum cinerariifolium]
MQKKNEKHVTKSNSNREQLSKYETDYEKDDDDDDDVEVAMVKLHYAHEALEREVRELEGKIFSHGGMEDELATT